MFNTPDDDPYLHPDLYDLEYDALDEDLAFYVSLARSSPGPVLELGCGTGRLTVPMAETGCRVVGVDRAPAMLARMRERLARSPADLRKRVEVVEADVLALDLGERFARVVWPFNALHHCRDVDALGAAFASAARHLAPDGVMALDAYLPDWQLYARPLEPVERREVFDPATGEGMATWTESVWDAATWIHHVWYVFDRATGPVRMHLQLHMYPLTTLRAAAAAAGLEIVREAAEFDGRPMTPDATRWIATLRSAALGTGVQRATR